MPVFERTDRSSGFLLFRSGSCRQRLSVDGRCCDVSFPIARFRASRAYPSLSLCSSPPVTSLPSSSSVGVFPMMIVIPRARQSSSARSMVGRWPRPNSDRNAFAGRRAARAASSAVSCCLSSSALMTCAKRSVADRFTVLFLAVMVSSRRSPHCLRRLVGGLTRCPSVGGSRRSPFGALAAVHLYRAGRRASRRDAPRASSMLAARPRAVLRWPQCTGTTHGTRTMRRSTAVRARCCAVFGLRSTRLTALLWGRSRDA